MWARDLEETLDLTPDLPSTPEPAPASTTSEGVVLDLPDTQQPLESPDKGPVEPIRPPPLKPKTYDQLLELAGLWHVRLGHLGLALLKKIAANSAFLPDFTPIRDRDFNCLAYI